MNWPFVAAGCIALVGSVIHGVVGDRLVRRIGVEALRPQGKFLIRVTWHFTTIAFVVLGIVLVSVGVRPHSAISAGVGYTAGALFSCWSAFVLIASFWRGGVRGWLSHPAPVLLSIAALLIWSGVARL